MKPFFTDSPANRACPLNSFHRLARRWLGEGSRIANDNGHDASTEEHPSIPAPVNASAPPAPATSSRAQSTTPASSGSGVIRQHALDATVRLPSSASVISNAARTGNAIGAAIIGVVGVASPGSAAETAGAAYADNAVARSAGAANVGNAANAANDGSTARAAGTAGAGNALDAANAANAANAGIVAHGLQDAAAIVRALDPSGNLFLPDMLVEPDFLLQALQAYKRPTPVREVLWGKQRKAVGAFKAVTGINRCVVACGHQGQFHFALCQSESVFRRWPSIPESLAIWRAVRAMDSSAALFF
jgi:hypothetical protein